MSILAYAVNRVANVRDISSIKRQIRLVHKALDDGWCHDTDKVQRSLIGLETRPRQDCVDSEQE